MYASVTCVNTLIFCFLIAINMYCRGFLGKEDLKKEDLGVLRAYYEESFGFPYLLDLGGTIRSTTDLGDLW